MDWLPIVFYVVITLTAVTTVIAGWELIRNK
jgi:hypothetical protein